MTTPLTPKSSAPLLLLLAGLVTAYAWDPLPVKEDRLVFMPGSQQGSVSVDSALRCDNCHGGYNRDVEPAYNWRGSLMGSAARDPLWMACLAATLQDSINVLGNPNVGDLCIRCHSPGGWLGGRSDPVNLTLFSGSDFEGVNCDSCHKMVDPIAAVRQLPALPAETDSTATREANKTFTQDVSVLGRLTLFDGTAFLDPVSQLPTFYNQGYVEGTAGQFCLDPTMPSRGPRYDAGRRQHTWYYSRFHKTSYACGTCHDVSNPVLGRLLSGDMALPEKKAGASYIHVERTFSEFMLSAYAQPGGAAPNPKINLPAGSTVAKCQDCHMRDVTGKAAMNATAPVRTDLALHDQTGGNAWMAGILASVDKTGIAYDPYNYAVLSGEKYPGARIDVAGIQTYGGALKAGEARALQQLQMAADLEAVAENASDLTLRIVNNTGHKLISGFPEGRRMWLNVKFFKGRQLLGEINPFTPLVVTKDAAGNDEYVSGGNLTSTHDRLVYEVGVGSTLTGEDHTLHFALGTHVHNDNRIPPKGFDINGAADRLVMPRWHAEDTPDYFTEAEYAGGYDEVTVVKPAGTTRWEAALYYQTTSKKYVEFLRDEISGTGTPLPGHDYIIQTDPFFETLRDWGRALYDLWLHNGGCPPILMTSIASR